MRSTASAPAFRGATSSTCPAPSSPRAAAGRTASPSRFRRQAEAEQAAAPGPALDPYAPAVALDDARRHGEADAAAPGTGRWIQAREHAEDLVALVGGD